MQRLHRFALRIDARQVFVLLRVGNVNDYDVDYMMIMTIEWGKSYKFATSY